VSKDPVYISEIEDEIFSEVCLVWGPPLSGQRYWMTKMAEESSEEVVTQVMPIDIYEENSMKNIFEALDQSLSHNKKDFVPIHIYCELPWNIVYDSELLEEWISCHPEFIEEKSRWILNIVGIFPSDAETLPAVYRKTSESFAKETESSIVILKSENDEISTSWLGTEALDFGPDLEINEERVWPDPGDNFEKKVFNFKPDKEFECLTMSLGDDSSQYYALFDDLCQGVYGDIWGAEAFWRNPDGLFEVLTLTQGQVFSWESSHYWLLRNCPLNGAVLNLVGSDLKLSHIRENNKPANFS